MRAPHDRIIFATKLQFSNVLTRVEVNSYPTLIENLFRTRWGLSDTANICYWVSLSYVLPAHAYFVLRRSSFLRFFSLCLRRKFDEEEC